MIDNRYGLFGNILLLIGNLAIRFWWVLVTLAFIGLLILCSSCSSMSVTKVTYTLGGGLFVPASISVEQTAKGEK
jgi:hypothetical protein